MERKVGNEGNNNPMIIPVLQTRQAPLPVNPPQRSADEAKQPIGRFNRPSE